MTYKDLYACLGVPRTCGDSEIKQAYHKMALKYHPDRNKNVADQERFKEIAHAYNVLSNPEKRFEYDYESILMQSAGPSYSSLFSYGAQKQHHQKKKYHQQQQQQQQQRQAQQTRQSQQQGQKKRGKSSRPQQAQPQQRQKPDSSKKSFFGAEDFFGNDASSTCSKK